MKTYLIQVFDEYEGWIDCKQVKTLAAAIAWVLSCEGIYRVVTDPGCQIVYTNG